LNLENLTRILAAAQGRVPFDLVVHNVRLLNVHTGEVLSTDVGIKDGHVAVVRPGLKEGMKRFNGRGLYLLPGFIDAHVHIESTLLTPAALAEAIVPHGTTALLCDPMEIANVAGLAGVLEFLTLARGLPYRIFLQVPSRVPTAPGLETTGGTLGLPEVRELLSLPQALALGELDPAKVLSPSEEHLAKVLEARRLGKVACGHAAGLAGPDLSAYAAAGLADDHECVTYDELLARLRLGLAVMVREGSSERNLETLITGVVRENIDTHNLMFCTDDKHPLDILREGHIDWCVSRAIELSGADGHPEPGPALSPGGGLGGGGAGPPGGLRPHPKAQADRASARVRGRPACGRRGRAPLPAGAPRPTKSSPPHGAAQTEAVPGGLCPAGRARRGPGTGDRAHS